MATPALPQPSWRKTPLQPIDLWQHLRDNAHQLGQSHNGSSQAVRVLRAARDAYVDAQQKRKHTLALDLLEQALRIKRGFLGADNYFVRKAERELTRCCNTIALCELKAGRISSAEHLLLQGLNRNPSPSAKEALLTNLGLCKYHGGDYSGARRLWGSMKKPCPYLLLALSATYFQENDTTFALLYATKAVEECNRRERTFQLPGPLGPESNLPIRDSNDQSRAEVSVLTALAHFALGTCACEADDKQVFYVLGLRILRKLNLEIIPRSPAIPSSLRTSLWSAYVDRCIHIPDTCRTPAPHYEIVFAQKHAKATLIQHNWRQHRRRQHCRSHRLDTSQRIADQAATLIQGWIRMTSTRAQFIAFRRLAAEAELPIDPPSNTTATLSKESELPRPFAAATTTHTQSGITSPSTDLPDETA